MKLFQIEEPEGGPVDPDAPGAAVGIDLGAAAVAVAVGGNAELLPDADGAAAPDGDMAALLLALRIRAERQLARPVTHAVIVADANPAEIAAAAGAAGLAVLRILPPAKAGGALAAARLAEDLA